MPKSTNHSSPRLAFGMFGFSPVVDLESFVSGGNQIGFGLDAVRVVINNATATLPELSVNGLLNPHEFLSGQIRQYGFDFSDRTHEAKITSKRGMVKYEPAD